MALTDTGVRQAKPSEKERKLFDEKGLFLLVTPKGSKLWRLKYRHLGKEKKLSLGAYPEVSLKRAREKRDEARAALFDGKDPSAERKRAIAAGKIAASNSFDDVAKEYIEKLEKDGRAEVTIAKTRWLLSKLSAAIGDRPVSEIEPYEILAVLKKVEARGQHETARRLRSFASRVFRFAVATARATSDPAQPLVGALVTPSVNHHAAITDEQEFGRLLTAIEQYEGQPITRLAMLFTAHVFQRPGEIRKAEWREIDFEQAVWKIPASRMKQRREHVVPLSDQAIDILKAAKQLSGNHNYVFPKLGSWKKPMSENAINGALRRMGFSSDMMTAHGFRSTASSLLNESGKWSPDAIERALSHADQNQIRATYHRGAHWQERVAMATWWSDYIDELKVRYQVSQNAA